MRAPSVDSIAADWSRPAGECWACGAICKLERAHILPHAGGGGPTPDNFFLLCNYCHKVQPDGAPREAQLEWLEGAESWLARAFRDAEPVAAYIQEKLTPMEFEFAVGAMREDLGLEEISAGKGATRQTNVRSSMIWVWAQIIVDAARQARAGDRPRGAGDPISRACDARTRDDVEGGGGSAQRGRPDDPQGDAVDEAEVAPDHRGQKEQHKVVAPISNSGIQFLS